MVTGKPNLAEHFRFVLCALAFITIVDPFYPVKIGPGLVDRLRVPSECDSAVQLVVIEFHRPVREINPLADRMVSHMGSQVGGNNYKQRDAKPDRKPQRER